MLAAICDDEPYMREDLRARLQAYMEDAGVTCEILCFSSGESLLQTESDFDIVFLDIQMDGLSGMETARRLRLRGYCGLLVFITVLRDYVFDAFELDTVDYLLKPLDDDRFRRVLTRLLEKISSDSQNSLSIRRGSACRIVPFSEIVYCEVMDRKVYVHTKSGQVIDYYSRLDELERLLNERFFRCHRSYLVNLQYVRGFQNGMARLIPAGEVPVSRSRTRDFSQAILRFMTEKRS